MEKQSFHVKRDDFPGGVWNKYNLNKNAEENSQFNLKKKKRTNSLVLIGNMCNSYCKKK